MLKQALKGKNALITGATGGLGTAIAKELAQCGCNLFLTGRNDVKLQSLRSELGSNDINVFSKVTDLADKKEVKSLIETAEETFPVDILINNAGCFPIKSILESEDKDYENCFSINVQAPFFLSRDFGKNMCERGWGRIVNIGSSSAYNGSEKTGLYCASKHALLGLSRSLYLEYKQYGVRVYNVSPGSVQTEMGRTDFRQDFSTFVKPEEVAEYLAFIIGFDAEGISEEIRFNRITVR